MLFSKAEQVDQCCWSMRYADWPRSQNRARINSLFNGNPPWTEKEAEEEGVQVNFNDLTSTRLSHDARAQFYNGFLKPGIFFTARTDRGPVYKRSEWGSIVTKEVNRVMKRSIRFFECMRSKFASGVLHGIGPSVFESADAWCPRPLGVEDVFVPSETLLTMENVPFFAIARSFTAPEFISMVRGPRVDPAWNPEMVDSILQWLDHETSTLMSSNYPSIWSPEKRQERLKSDGGFYAIDRAPTIDMFDFYFWNDAGRKSGWSRRMILDGWSAPSALTAGSYRLDRKTSSFRDSKGSPRDVFREGRENFVYSSDRKLATDIHQIINFQFADLSAVAPFQYHSVRSLGFLLYSVCHIQNRLNCRFTETVFEQMMMYFRVRGEEDAQRALRVNLFNRSVLDSNIDFIPPDQRYQVDAQLVQLGMDNNRTLINQNSSSFSSSSNMPFDKRDKTATQVMAEQQQMTQLVSAALNQAYHYQRFEYDEIFRRFFNPNSRDPDVLRFRAACMRQGVPENVLNDPEGWEVEPETITGAGNKTLELAIAEKLMAIRTQYDPEPQRDILREVTLALTDDPAKAERWVPKTPVKVSDAVHDAQLAAGTLMQGLPVALKTGMNHIEYVETLLVSMAMVVQQITERDNTGTMEEVIGLNNMANHIGEHIGIIAQNPEEKQRVKVYGDQLGQLMNLVKAFAQRLAEQQEQEGQQVDPKLQAEIQAIMAKAEVDRENRQTAHSQRTAERQVQWEMEMERKAQEFQAEMQRKLAEAQQELAINRERASIELQKDRQKLAQARNGDESE